MSLSLNRKGGLEKGDFTIQRSYGTHYFYARSNRYRRLENVPTNKVCKSLVRTPECRSQRGRWTCVGCRGGFGSRSKGSFLGFGSTFCGWMGPGLVSTCFGAGLGGAFSLDDLMIADSASCHFGVAGVGLSGTAPLVSFFLGEIGIGLGWASEKLAGVCLAASFLALVGSSSLDGLPGTGFISSFLKVAGFDLGSSSALDGLTGVGRIPSSFGVAGIGLSPSPLDNLIGSSFLGVGLGSSFSFDGLVGVDCILSCLKEVAGTDSGGD